jgi:hypothetical protein
MFPQLKPSQDPKQRLLTLCRPAPVKLVFSGQSSLHRHLTSHVMLLQPHLECVKVCCMSRHILVFRV